jgi:hypothetical protein
MFSETLIHSSAYLRYRGVCKRACLPNFLEEFFSETPMVPLKGGIKITRGASPRLPFYFALRAALAAL